MVLGAKILPQYTDEELKVERRAVSDRRFAAKTQDARDRLTQRMDAIDREWERRCEARTKPRLMKRPSFQLWGDLGQAGRR